MKKIFKEVVQLDTTTRYECDGTIIIIPEDWNEHFEVSNFPQVIPGRFSVAKNGKAVFRPRKPETNNVRYEELYNTRKPKGTGNIIRRTMNHVITITVTNRDDNPNQVIRDQHDGHLEIMAWMKENKGKIRD